MEVVDIDNLTLEEYLAMTSDEQGSVLVRPAIGAEVRFEIKEQFMREPRANPFSGNRDDDAYEHVENVLYIASLFNTPGVSHDAVMLRVFSITLTGAARRWIDRLPVGAVDTWALLKKHFIQRYCPPSKISNQLMEIHNFKQEGDETLYQAWDRYNDLLYKCPTHDLNNQQKVNIFYKGINIATRQMLDYQGPITGMTPTLAIEAIQKMADHSQKWHDGGIQRSLGGNLDGIAAITNKLENLGRDILKLKESVHAIQVGCESCGGGHLTKNCPLIDDDSKVEEVKYGETNRPFQGANGNGNGYHGEPPTYYNRRPFGERRYNLKDTINKYLEDSTKRQKEQEEWLKNFQENTNKSLFSHDESLKNLETMIGKLSNEVQRRNEAQESKPIVCKAIFSENDASNDNSSMVQENDAGSADKSQLRHNPTSELRCNWDTWFDIFLELDESGMHVINAWPGNTNMVPKSPSKKKCHWYKAIPVDNNKSYDLWASCNLHNDICDGGDDKERVKNNKYMWSTINDDERLIIFSIEDIEEPPIKHCCNPIIIMEDESTRAWPTCNPFREYCNGGGNMKGEEWTCLHELERHDIKFGNLSFHDWYMIRFEDAIINAGLLSKLKLDYEEHCFQQRESVDEKSIKDDTSCKDDPLSNTNNKTIRKHWCEKIKTIGEVFWASCNPFVDDCNGGSSIARVGDDEFLWTSTNDDERTELPLLDKLGFDDWVKIKYGKVDASTKEKIWKGCMSEEDPSEEIPNNTSEVMNENSKDTWGNEKEECKRVLIEELLDDEWFKRTESDDDDIEGIMDYLELQGQDGVH